MNESNPLCINQKKQPHLPHPPTHHYCPQLPLISVPRAASYIPHRPPESLKASSRTTHIHSLTPPDTCFNAPSHTVVLAQSLHLPHTHKYILTHYHNLKHAH